MLETLDHTIRIGSTPTFLYFDLYNLSPQSESAPVLACEYSRPPSPVFNLHPFSHLSSGVNKKRAMRGGCIRRLPQSTPVSANFCRHVSAHAQRISMFPELHASTSHQIENQIKFFENYILIAV